MAHKGEFILKNKLPGAEETAVRRMGTPLEEDLYEKGKKRRATPAEEEMSEAIAQELMPQWLHKLQEQMIKYDDHVPDGVRMNLFKRWAKRNAVVTTKLSEAEYLRIAAGDETPRSRETVLHSLQQEQLSGYEDWLNYLLKNQGRDQYESWFRYLVLSEITKRDDRDHRRDAETTAGVLPLNMAALAKVRDDFKPLIAAYEQEDEQVKALPRGEERQEANQRKTKALNALTSYPFHEKYLAHSAEVAKAANEKLGYTDGWHAFTDPEELSRISSGTPWCLAGRHVAEDYLSRGEEAKMRVDFQDGRPKIGVYVVDDEVREVRGADDSQNLDPAYANAVEEELAQYGNGDNWRAQAEDARRVGVIAALLIDDPEAPLSVEQLKFLYEVDRPIQSFGYDRDDRVDDIQRARSENEDICTIFGCTDESEIARNVEDVNDSTKIWINGIGPGVLAKLAEHHVEYVYDSFPGTRIDFHRLSLDSAKSASAYEPELDAHDVDLANNVRKMLGSEAFAKSALDLPKEVVLVELPLKMFWLDDYTSLKVIEERAREFGLERVPAAAVPAFVLADKPTWSRDANHEAVIDMDPILVDGDPEIFKIIKSGDDQPLLYSYDGKPGHEWSQEEVFVFRVK